MKTKVEIENKRRILGQEIILFHDRPQLHASDADSQRLIKHVSWDQFGYLPCSPDVVQSDCKCCESNSGAKIVVKLGQ